MKWLNLQDNINLLSLIGFAVLMIVSCFVVGLYMKQMKTRKSEGELCDEVYDGISEYKNNLPVGWAAMFVLLIFWAIWYFLVGYPLNSYSQIGEYNDEVRAYNEKFSSVFANPSKETLFAMGESLFLVECVVCHGISGDGIDGKAANLKIWGSEDGILEAIHKGSKGLDYPLGEMPADNLTGQDAKAVAAFVAKEISAIKSTKHPELVKQGRAQWGVCAACHGDDGKGMDGMAPDLTKYGSAEFVVEVLNRGKHGFIGQMPNFGNNGRGLSDIQKRAVGEYISTLSKN
ncbi:cytochrome C oxidase Cbb3 [Campylobacter sp. FMV-PI01]|uniref:Cytochrome c oxidase subunit III n=1 Tax=Campylobacter portucalensis TaxID=2608384 RepID=A0A6L5WG66_9BACT|nr:cbb3-type cytochrome c oxidase N-terminal domain-containing protein [Campylobacter portucalensis]MSN96138.1 cytochrome C oxidase Cbb3 [Campylobacter portucalensis]